MDTGVEKLLEGAREDPEFERLYQRDRLRRIVADEFFRLRKTSGLTQEVLGQKAGWAQPYVARLERGEANSIGAIEAMQRYAEACGATAVMLYIDPLTLKVRGSVSLGQEAKVIASLDELEGTILNAGATVPSVSPSQNLDATWANLRDTEDKARERYSVKNPQELLAWNAQQLQPAAEKAVAYSRLMYDIATSTQAEFSKVAEAQLADANAKFVSMIDAAAKNAPAGSETAVAMMKSAIAAVNSAYDSLSKASGHAVEMTEANVTAATKTTRKRTNQENRVEKLAKSSNRHRE